VKIQRGEASTSVHRHESPESPRAARLKEGKRDRIITGGAAFAVCSHDTLTHSHTHTLTHTEKPPRFLDTFAAKNTVESTSF